MERIINGMRFEGQRVENCWDVRTWSCNGVMERSARPVIDWSESLIEGWSDKLDPVDPVRDAEWLAEKRLRSLKVSAARAKTQCRRFIIHEGFDEMLTLTYRQSQPDRALCKVHFKAWVRRMKAALGGFRFCAAFEAQERGSMHVHCATHKMPKEAIYKGVKVLTWKLGTRIWRDVVGADNGLCFVGAKNGRDGRRHHKLSLAKMANYVSKYILKDFEGAPAESNRYSRSNGDVVADVHVCRFNGTLIDVVAACFQVNDGDVIVSHRVGHFGDSWWLCTELSENLQGCRS